MTEGQTDDATTTSDLESVGEGRRGARRARPWLIFPGVVLLVFAALVALNLSGSSIANLSVSQPAPGLVAGTPRAVRVDEWFLQTPIAVSSVRQGYPRQPWIGLSRVDQAATSHGGPTYDWSTVLKPQDYGYLAGASRGLAWSWWWSFVIGLLGTYAFFGLLTRRPLWSALLAAVATLTPYTAWWSAPAPGLFIGYTAAAAALMMAAWTVRRRRHAVLCAVGSGVAGAALVLALYPPWVVSLGYVAIAAGVGFALDRRVPWRRFAGALVGGAVTGGVLVGAWYLQHRDAISALLDTYYPGSRVSKAGTGSLRQMLDGPLNFWLAGDAGQTLGTIRPGTAPANQSEAASGWIPLPIVLIVILGLVEMVAVRAFLRWRRHAVSRHGAVSDSAPGSRRRDAIDGPPDPIWTLVLTSLAVVLLLAWTLLDLPDVVGSLTQLRRVEPIRTPLALGFGALIVVTGAAMMRSERRPLLWRWPAVAAGIVLTVLATLWADRKLPWRDELTPSVLVALSGFVLAAGFAGLLVRKTRLTASVVLAAYAALSWGIVNPLQHGITPITRDSLGRELNRLAGDSDNRRVEVFYPNGIYPMVGRVRAAGFQSLTGSTLYPDADLMSKLAPTQKALWNNYAQYTFLPAAQGTAAIIRQVNGTQFSITLSPCDPVLLAVADPGWVVAYKPLPGSCLRRVGTVGGEDYPRAIIYRVDRR